ncbi:MAG: hypothetical protein AWT59_2223 [Candidatus Gallionella acididurans]|uniref:Uncharacterized protein n=1 Tax=Candidatus Gallionella acididurans TaxID=1796491 RepID=A0A139BRN2_9PROT|nr:MAG: hypothetical protein AWT59_2223 [Candidatus Gallionella acididurans]
MKTCYRYENGTFVDAQSPFDATIGSWNTAIADAGYRPQLQVPTVNDHDYPVATIYRHIDGNDVPEYLVAIWGEDSEIALLVVDDFIHLMPTLTAIEPLTRYSTNLSE